MTRRSDQDPASGLLHELDTIRTLLDDSFREEDIPVLDDPVLDYPALDGAAADDAEMHAAGMDKPVADDSLPQPAPELQAPAVPGSVSEAPLEHQQLVVPPQLETAIREGIDAAIQGWLEDTLPRQLDILRARLLETVRSEIRARLAAHENPARTGKPADPPASVTEDIHGQ